MHLIALAALLCLCPQNVEGLRPGETAVALAPRSSVADEVRHGRVIGAFDGRPVEGATVELWTEEITGATGGFHRIGRSTTTADGRFTIRARSGNQKAEKLRVSAPNHLVFSGTAGDVGDDIRLFPVGDRRLRVKVIDVEGRPVPGARLTTTYSCAHDLSAIDRRTDALGVAECPELGLQRDIQELRVRATGFRAIKYLDPDRALGAPGTPEVVAVLQRQRPARVRILDRHGAPLLDRAIYIQDDDGYHIVRSDREGIVRIDSRYGCGALVAYVLRPDQNQYIGEFLPWPSGETTIRIDGEEWPDDVVTGRIRIEGSDDLPSLRLQHEEGYSVEARVGETVTFPSGKVSAFHGGGTSGIVPTSRSFELGGDEVFDLEVVATEEPTVTLVATDGVTNEIFVQCGDETRGPVKPGRRLAVPPGIPLVLLQECHLPRRLSVDAVTSGMTIDLAGATGLSKEPSSDSQNSCEHAFVDRDGRPVDGKLALRPHGSPCTIEKTGLGRWVVNGPIDTPYLLRLRTPGHMSTWFRGRLQEDSSLHEVLVPKPARLIVEAEFAFTIEGVEEEQLEELAPGPFQFVLRRPDGRRLGCEILLADGEVRTLTVNW